MDPVQREEANIIEGAPEWWRQNLAAIVAATFLIVAVAILAYNWHLRNELRVEEARLSLAAAKTPQEKLEVAQKFLDLPLVGTDLLTIASEQLTQNNAKGAISTYELFLVSFPEHPLRNGARLGLGFAHQAAGNQKEALAEFVAVGQTTPPDTYTPTGLLSAARIYEALGEKDRARQFLTDVTQRFAGTPFAAEAQQQLGPPPAPDTPPPPQAQPPAGS